MVYELSSSCGQTSQQSEGTAGVWGAPNMLYRSTLRQKYVRLVDVYRFKTAGSHHDVCAIL